MGLVGLREGDKVTCPQGRVGVIVDKKKLTHDIILMEVNFSNATGNGYSILYPAHSLQKVEE